MKQSFYHLLLHMISLTVEPDLERLGGDVLEHVRTKLIFKFTLLITGLPLARSGSSEKERESTNSTHT
jgi:hypothetical protein